MTRQAETTQTRPHSIGRTLLIALAAAGVWGTSACVPEPAPQETAADQKRAVEIGVDADSAEQRVLGEIYQQVLIAIGRDSHVTAIDLGEDDSALDALRTAGVEFAITCTGSLLAQLDPAAARQLERAFADVESIAASTEASEDTYDATVGALPGTVMTVDPSPAQGCAAFAADDAVLPENIIPVFTKTTFSRSEVQRINFITRVLSTEDVAEMAQEAESGEPLDVVVADWLLEYASIDPNVSVDGDAEVTQEQPPV
ncbi:hypothetical protein [Corynebacterium sp. LK2510]|uniref:hypothetical protein n=1 Tax=Corynebacterium sp. LK2510 TaxID=3110472 RepID=UPI0034CFF425